MRKRLLKLFFLSGLALICAIGLMACDFGGGNKDDPKPEHQHAYIDTVISPTCTEQGYTLHRCTCGNEYRDNYVNATGHTYSKEWSFDETAHWHIATCEHDDQVSSFSAHQWNGGVVTTEPTEDAEGIKTYTCIICKATKTDKIPKVVHVCSYTEQNTSIEYLASEADCTNPAKYFYSCSCGKKGGETFSSGTPLGHNYGVATYEWNGQNCTATRICQHDNSHKETETVIGVYVKDTDATCTVCEKGHYKATFTKSAFVEQNTAKDSVDKGIPLGHSFTNYIPNGNATCTNDGTKTAQCDRCSATNTITDIGSKLGHTYSNDWTTDDDYHWYQATCVHSELKKDKTLHDWVDTGVIITEATETVEGEKEQECSVCNKTRIIKTGYASHVHTFDTENWSYDETHHWHSATCGHDEILDFTKHSFGDWEETPATVDKTGIKIRVCSECGYVEEIEIPMIESRLVTFYDGDETIIQEKIELGSRAIYFEPEKDGYIFDGWKDNVTQKIFKADLSVATREYTADMIMNDFMLPEVLSDQNYYAQYVLKYSITFIDGDGSELATLEAPEGISFSDIKDIPFPKYKKEGYHFEKWDNEFDFLSSDLIITAIYEADKFSVILYDYYGNKISNDNDKVEYGGKPNIPIIDEYVYDEKNHCVYTFTNKWQRVDEQGNEIEGKIDDIREKSIFKPIYKIKDETKATPPVIIFTLKKDKDSDRRSKLSIDIWLPKGIVLYAMSFDFSCKDPVTMWKDADGNVNVEINSSAETTWLNAAKATYVFEVNINTQKFYFQWATGKDEGVSFLNGFSYIIDFISLSTASSNINYDTLEVNEKNFSLYVKDESGEKFRLSPYIIKQMEEK